jgi:hypothetical protein
VWRACGASAPGRHGGEEEQSCGAFLQRLEEVRDLSFAGGVIVTVLSLCWPLWWWIKVEGVASSSWHIGLPVGAVFRRLLVARLRLHVGLRG